MAQKAQNKNSANTFDSARTSNNTIAPQDAQHSLKLSIDLLSVKDLRMAANVYLSYQLRLSSGVQAFRTERATAVSQAVESRIEQGFASFQFNASKVQLFQILAANTLHIRMTTPGETSESGQSSEVELGNVNLDLKEILSAPLKQSAAAMVRVADQYLPIRGSPSYDQTPLGLLRTIVYLEDMGEAASSQQKIVGNVAEGGNTQDSIGTDYQAVWQLEMWKRAEMAKFLVHLKQRELQKVEEVTGDWRRKELERDQTFNDSLLKVTSLEGKLRQKAQDLQRREERIFQLEEELRHKIQEVARQLTQKEEEILAVKTKFKEERHGLEFDKKRLSKELVDTQASLEAAHKKFFSLKSEVEDSPISVLRNELTSKQMECTELRRETEKALSEREDFRKKFEQLKHDLVVLKRKIDDGKEAQLAKQAEELEQLKQMMRNREAQAEERSQIDMLRQQLTTLQSRQSKTAGANEQDGTRIERERVIVFDDFARQQSPQQNQNRQQLAASVMYQQPKFLGSGGDEWERLMQERQNLIGSGCYSVEDPLIREMDRQIQVAEMRQQKTK